MKLGDIFKKFVGKKISRTEVAVLRVSMLVAALDGDVSKEEFEEFRRLAKECEGYSEDEEKRVFVETLRSAGYLMLLARVSDQRTLLEAFAAEAEKFLPSIVDFGSLGVEGAVEIWKSMANADGDFAEIEQRAIEMLEKILTIRRDAQVRAAGEGVFSNGGFVIRKNKHEKTTRNRTRNVRGLGSGHDVESDRT